MGFITCVDYPNVLKQVLLFSPSESLITSAHLCGRWFVALIGGI
ncbi:hypothetical protein QOT19_01675 [Serratia marcescens]|nr:hypothetical protein [Serratia marcescens]MDP0518047.1 hypothetical protein [Serratia marcescens]